MRSKYIRLNEDFRAAYRAGLTYEQYVTAKLIKECNDRSRLGSDEGAIDEWLADNDDVYRLAEGIEAWLS